MMRCFKFALAVALLSSVSLANELKVGRYFSDSMVLQRDKTNTIRGMAKPGAEVEVSLAGQTKTGKADDKGVWAVTLDPLAASSKAMDLTVKSGRDKAVVKDIVVGDVVLFARQTSIDISLGRDEEGKKAAEWIQKSSVFRAISIKMIPSADPQADLHLEATEGWSEVKEEQALKMSGAACQLGRQLAKEVDVPVGIVDLNMGYHFPIAWLSRETLLIPYPGAGGVVGRVEKYESQYKAFVEKTPWGKHKTVFEKDPRDVEFALYPSAGYNAVILPLSGVGLKGAVLQVGNDYPYMYYEQVKKEGKMSDRELMNETYIKTYDIRKEGFRMEPAMINRITGDWRKALGDDSLRMAFVAPPSSALWPYAVHNIEMRELQRKVAEKEEATDIILPGMENVPFSGQPKDEALLAERSLKWARGALYSKAVSTGPVYDRHEGEGTAVTIHYKEGTAKGLKAENGALDYFEVADVDGQYVPAKAVIKGETIELSCDDVSRIFYIRYNYVEKPDQGLVNEAGLPAVPFRTQDAGHDWLVRYKDDDLPEEYSTPANEWKGGAVTLINAQLERVGYPHFEGWLGPVGVKTGPFGPNMGVREVAPGSPAEGKLFVGDVIYSANGQMLGDDEEMTMAAAITKSEEKDGKLVLGVHRDGKNLDVELKLKVMGRYSATAPWDCIKSERIVKDLEDLLVRKGAPSGFLHGDAMFLLGAGSPANQWLVRRTATGIKGGGGGNNWSLGYATQYLSEYYLATGDKRVLPALQAHCDTIAEMQIQEEGKRNGGWYGRGNSPRSYPAMAHTGVSAMLGLALARECGVNVDPGTFERGLAYLERKGAPVGQIIYGDAFRDEPENIDPEKMLAGKLHTANGKIPEAAVLYEVLGDRRSAYINSQISVHGWYSTYGGHGGHYWDQYWTPLGAAVHSKEAYMYFMKGHRWFREMNRMFDGSLITGGKGTVAAPGLALVVPQRRLRILGAPKSPFSPGAPEILKPALASYDARDYAKAEALALALLDEPTLDRNAAPTIAKLAEEAKRMQDGIASDLAAIEALTKEGRLHEAGMIMAQLTPVIAEDDPRLAAASEQIKNGQARTDDQALYAASLKAGDGEDAEGEAQSADDLKKLEEKKKAEAAAAAAAAHKWECLTPKEFVPDRKSKPNDEARPAEEATKWRFTVLEHRDNAPDGWEKPGFDDSSWVETMYPLSWHLNHVTLHRAKFTIKDKSAYDRLRFKGWVFRQQDIAIYLNGTLIGRVNNIEQKTGTIENEFKEAAMTALKDGENTIAIATRQNWRWGMLSMRVYNGGFDFMLSARLAKEEE